MRRLIYFLAIMATTLMGIGDASARKLHIVPEPAYIDMASEGEFVVTGKTKIVVWDDMWSIADIFAEEMME